MEMTRDITKQILKNEQVGRKVFLERQLQLATLFVEIFKVRDPFGPKFFTSGSI